MGATKYLPIRVNPELYDNITALAAKKHISNSELVRRLIESGLSQELSRESIDYTRDQIHEEIKTTCYPQFDRIAKLEAKIGYQSVASFYLLCYIIDKILPAAKRIEFEEMKQNARNFAIAYLKPKEKEVMDFLKSEEQATPYLRFNDKRSNQYDKNSGI